MIKKSPKFYIGIDSGGTKCDIILINSHLNIIKSETFSSLHFSQSGLEKTTRKIKRNISKFIKNNKLNSNNLRGLCIGMTGVRRKKDREDLKIKLMEFINHKNVIVETDTKIAHFGAFKGKNGIVFIIGTGSILYGIINKKVYRVGGWGKLLGDYGSGYHIGQEALKEVVKEYDNRKEFSLLTKALKKEFDITHSNIIQKIYHEKFPVQNVAKIVFECAKANDSKSLKIINESAEKLCEQLNGFMKLCKWKKKLGIALTGSIIENENIFSNKLKLYIRDNFSNLEILKNVNSPAFGAALMAKKNFK